VNVTAYENYGSITDLIINNKFTVVVLTEVTLRKQLEISTLCHENNISVIIGDIKGVFGNIFCDFGSNFIVNE
jgi:ubiquitin-activating enzyme E1